MHKASRGTQVVPGYPRCPGVLYLHNDLLAELSFVTLTIHLCYGLNDREESCETEENVFFYCLTFLFVT